MVIKLRVDAIGHGLQYNRYPLVFEFTMNVAENYKDDDSWVDTIAMRVQREAKRKTACDHVTIKNYEILTKV